MVGRKKRLKPGGKRTKSLRVSVVTQWLFLRAMGIVYLCAFLSLGFQIDGLLGSKGILPAVQYIDALSASLPNGTHFLFVPTLVWLNSSDAFMQFLCWGGAIAALCVVLSFCTAPLLIVCWLFYLSLVNVGQDFLSFQWDILLLEAGFLAILWAPWQWTGPPWKNKLVLKPETKLFRAVLLLLRWLVFKLMFLSGAVKILSGDVTWRNFTALKYHYVTQPLPTPLAWLANQLPDWFQTACVAGVFITELCVPFLFFLPRKFRLVGAVLTMFLQIVILLTGNYTFFNLLTLTLCIPLLDDRAITGFFPKFLRAHLIEEIAPEGAEPTLGPMKRNIRRVGVTASFVMVGFATIVQISGAFEGFRAAPDLVRGLLAFVRPFHLVNSYGLFAVMTTTRPEISVEGSDDGVTWKHYTFRYKPGPLNRPPPIVAPFQPRLDWQMWFAALGPPSDSPWFFKFVYRLLDGSPDVVRLLEVDPFQGHPPKFIRAQLFDYRFTSMEEFQKTGNWWKRSPAGVFIPPLSKDNFRLSN